MPDRLPLLPSSERLNGVLGEPTEPVIPEFPELPSHLDPLPEVSYTLPSPGLGNRPMDIRLNPEEFQRLNQLRPGDDHFQRRALNQTFGDLLKGTAVQSLGVVVGTALESIGSLVDLFNPNFYVNVAKGQEDFKSNVLTQFGRDVREFSQEIAPIYQTRRAEEGFAPFDATWYASLFPSVFTVVGLMIPGGGVGLAAGRLARGLGAARNIQAGTRVLSSALASRHMESMMESFQLGEETYQDMISKGYDEEMARSKAGKVAQFRYAADYGNLLKDIVSWGLAFKAVNYASRSLSGRAANFQAHAPRNSAAYKLLKSEGKEMPEWLKGSGDLLKQGFLEGVEEINQGYMSLVASKWGDAITGVDEETRPGGVSFFLKSLTDGTVGEHLSDRHTWDEGIMGFFGGMLFGGLSPALAKTFSTADKLANDKVTRDIETQIQAINVSLDAYAAAMQEGNQGQADLVLSEVLSNVNMDALRRGTLDINKQLYESIAQATDEELVEMGLGAGVQETAQFALEHANSVESAFNRYMNMELGKNTAEIAMQAANIDSQISTYGQLAQRLQQSYNTSLEDSGPYKSLSSEGQQRLSLRHEEIALIQAITSQQEAIEVFQQRREQLTAADRLRISSMQEYIEEMKSQLAEIQQQRKEADEASKQTLSKEKHKRETAIINFTPKNKGANRSLFLYHTILATQQARQAELANLLSPEVLEELDKEITSQKEARQKEIEKESRKREEEQHEAEVKESAKQEKQLSDRALFERNNRDTLNELGYLQLEDYSLEDLQLAIDQNLSPEELSRFKQVQEEFAESPAELHGIESIIEERKKALGIETDPVVEEAPQQVETFVEDANEEEVSTEGASPTQAEEIEGQVSSATLEQPESQEVPSPENIHPSDIQPVKQADIKTGEWINSLTHDKVFVPYNDTTLVDGYPYTISPSGVVWDAKGRVVEGELKAYVLSELKRDFISAVPQELTPELNPPEGKEVTVKYNGENIELIVDEHGGVIHKDSLKKVDNSKIINMALIRAENNPARKVRKGNMYVYVLPDDRIISLSKSNLGEEILSDQESLTEKQLALREDILNTAKGESTPAELLMQQEQDQTVQVGIETQSILDEPVLEHIPESSRDQVRPTQRAYWRSSNNTFGGQEGSEPATAFFEDPDAQVVGTPVEFRLSLDEAALSTLPEEIARAYKEGIPIVKDGERYALTIGGKKIYLKRDHFPPIAVHLLNEDGTDLVAAGEPVRAFLPQPHSIKNNASAVLQVLKNRVDMYNAQLSGSPVRSTIISRSSGFPMPSDSKSNSVATLLNSLGKQKRKYRFGIIDAESHPVDVSGRFGMEVNGSAGNFILFIEGFEEKYYPHKLNVRNLNKEEASYTASLIRGYLTGKIGMDTLLTKENSPKVHGMTLGQYFDLTLFYGRDATNIYTKSPNNYRRNRTMYFDTIGGVRRLRLGDKIYTQDNIEAEFKNVAIHLAAHKSRQVSKNGFGDGNKLSNVIPAASNIHWFGMDITPTAENSYLDFLFLGAEPAVTTDVEVDNPKMIQPSIHFDSVFDTTLIGTRVEVDGVRYVVNMDEGTIIREDNNKEIKGVSPLGRKILNAVDWDSADKETYEKAEKEKEEAAKELDEKYGDAMEGIDPIEPVKFKAGEPPKRDFSRSIRYEIEAIQSILPPGVEVNIDPSMPFYANVAGHSSPARVWGMFFSGMIYLSENAPEGTAYHEAFHAVFNLSLTEEYRRKLYSAATPKFKERYKREPANDLELEEFMADEFSMYMLREGDYKVVEEIDGFFKRLWNLIKQLFSRPSEVDKLFNKIESGFFAQAPRYDSTFADSLSPRFKEASTVFTPAILDSMVKAIAFNIAERAGLRTSEDIHNIDLSLVPGIIKGYYNREKLVNTKRAELWAQAIIDPETLRKVQKKVEEFFFQMGIKGKNYKAFDYTMAIRGEYEGIDPEKIKDSKERLFIPTAYEFDAWGKSGANVRMMVYFLPKLNSLERKDGKLDYQFDPVTGDPVFVNGERVWELLLRTLSDVGSYSGMIDALRKAQEIEPSLSILADRLENPYTGKENSGLPQHKKNEFFHAFGSKVAMNFQTLIHGEDKRREPGPDGSYPFRVSLFDSDLYRNGNKLLNQWKSSFRGNLFMFEGENIKLNERKVKELISEYKTLSQKILDKMDLSLVPPLSDILNRAGISISPEALTVYLNRSESLQSGASSLVKKLDLVFVSDKVSSLATMLKQESSESYSSNNPFSLKIMRELARLSYEYSPELSQSSILAAEAKSKYMYSEANYYFDELNRLKQNPEYLKKVKQERMSHNLKLLDMIHPDMEYSVIANVKSRREDDQGRDYVDSHPYEEFITKYKAVLSGQIPALTFSDKKTSMVLKGVTIDPLSVLVSLDSNDKRKKSARFSQELIDQFAGYMQSEIQRVVQVQHDLDVLSDEQLIRTYHYDPKSGTIDRTTAKGATFVIFPQLSSESLSTSNPALHDLLYTSEGNVRPFSESMRAELRKEAVKYMESNLTREFKSMRKHSLINNEGTLSVPLIDSGYLRRTYYENIDESLRREISPYDRQFSAIGTAALNGLAYTLEQAILFQGDPAFFPSLEAWRKRTSGPAAFRNRLNTEDPEVPEFYTVAIAKDIVKASTHLEEIKASLQEVLKEDTFDKNKIYEILKVYEDITVTDGTAFITIDRAVQILRGEGRWQESDNDILSRWKKGDTDILKTQRGRRVAQLFLTPIKGVHYGKESLSPDINLRTPVYLKYAQFILLPGMAKPGSDLAKILNAMESQGIDELIFESATKVGGMGVSDVSNLDNIEFVKNTLSNNHWGRQVETPTDGVNSEGLEGVQVRRNLLFGIREGRTYEGMTSEQMLYNYNRAIEEITTRGLNELEADLGIHISPLTGLSQIKNSENFSSMMQREAKRKNSPKNVVDSYTTKGGVPRVSLDIVPHSSEAMLFSLYKNNAIRRDVFGGSFVQASSYGFRDYATLTSQEKEGIIIPEDMELRPPLMENGKVKAAQVFAPSWFGTVISQWYKENENRTVTSSQLTRDEIKAFFSHNPELLEFIGYRIPTQGLSSIEFLEVVGFLPEDLGDTMVVYEALTAKNDSDFDVDKMYGIIPEFKIVNGKPRLYEFYEDTESITQLRNIYNDVYGENGQMRSLIQILDRVKEKEKTESIDQILASEPRVSRDVNGWVIGGKEEAYLENRRNEFISIPPLEDFIRDNRGADPFSINSDSGLRNYRIHLMKAIMKNPEVMVESLSPVSNQSFVAKARSLANKVREESSSVWDYEFLPSSQIEVGRRFRAGKNMVGTTANHFSSHAISTKVNSALRKSEYLAALASRSYRDKNGVPYSSLSEYVDKNGDSIPEQLSTLLSGFLDASAEDSWSLDLNFNDDTSNIANMLLRIGSSWEQTLAYINQPILRELSLLIPAVRGKLVFPEGGTPETHLIRRYTKKLNAVLGNVTIQDALNRNIIKDKKPSELLSLANLNRGIGNKEEANTNPQYLYDQIQILESFVELDTVARSLSNFVSATKFDGDMPASVAQLNIIEFRLEEARESGWLSMGGYIEHSFLKAFNHVYKSASALSRGTFISQSVLGQSVLKSVIGHTGEIFKTYREENTLRDINNGLIMYALQSRERINQLENPIYRTPAQYKAMFFGNNTMPRRLIRLMEKPEMKSNSFANYLQPFIEVGMPEFIETSYREKSVLFSDSLIHGWEQMLASSDPEIVAFAEDLIPYALTTSGRRRSMNTFHELIPAEKLEELSDFLEEFKRTVANTPTETRVIEEEIFRNEYSNSSLAPEIKPKHLLRKSFENNMLTGFDVSLERLDHTIRQKGEVESVYVPEVVKVGNQLYKNITGVNSDNRVAYALIQKKGYHNRGFHIYEYFNPSSPSIVEMNNIPYSVPFGDSFQQVTLNDLFKAVPDDPNKRQFTMENVLTNKIC